MKTTTLVALLAALIIIGGGVWWYLNQGVAPQGATVINGSTGADYTPPTDTTASTTDNSGVGVGVDVGVSTAKTVTINYSSSGFSPASVTINKGDTVKFVSTDGSSMWIGSDEHPSHDDYDGTTRSTHCAAGYTGEKPFDQCGTGSSYSFTFTKAGNFAYHNHMAPQKEGTVIVK